EPARVEDGAHAPRQRAEIAAVETDGADGDSGGGELRRQRYRLARGRLAVIGVEEQGQALRPGASETLKGGRLVVMGFDEGVRHRANRRDAELPLGFDCRGSGKTGDVARAGGEQPGLAAVGAAEAEIEDRRAAAGE